MNREPTDWKCKCGAGLNPSSEEVAAGVAKCPVCGAEVFIGPEEETSTDEWEETQMLPLQDMARMAQDGVDVGVSGEWDTSAGDTPTKKDD